MREASHHLTPEQEAPPIAGSPSDIARYLRAALRFAKRLLPQDAVEADDVAQNVMIALTRKLSTIPGDQVLGWLYKATWLEVAKRKRTFSRNESRLAKLRVWLPGTAATPPGQEGGDLIFDLRRALLRLTRRQNDVLLLWMKGCDYDEIARACDISSNTVKDHLKKGLATIRRLVSADVRRAGNA